MQVILSDHGHENRDTQTDSAFMKIFLQKNEKTEQKKSLFVFSLKF